MAFTWEIDLPIHRDTCVWCVVRAIQAADGDSLCESALNKFNVTATEHITLLTADRILNKLGHRLWWNSGARAFCHKLNSHLLFMT